MANKGNDNNFQTAVVYINQDDVLVRTGSSHINGYIRSDDLDAALQTNTAEFFPYIARLNDYFLQF